MGHKVSDEFTVPLCRTHHRPMHRFGREAEWCQADKPEIDLLKIAKELWDQTQHGLGIDIDLRFDRFRKFIRKYLSL